MISNTEKKKNTYDEEKQTQTRRLNRHEAVGEQRLCVKGSFIHTYTI